MLTSCDYCGYAVEKKIDNGFQREFDADGSEHRCHQLEITLKLPDVGTFGIYCHVRAKDLLGKNAMAAYWEPAICQIRQELENRLANPESAAETSKV
jgi:hypothetical protein